MRKFIAVFHKRNVHCNFGHYLNTTLTNKFIFCWSRRLNDIGKNFENNQSWFWQIREDNGISMELSQEDVVQIQTEKNSATVLYVAQINKIQYKNI